MALKSKYNFLRKTKYKFKVMFIFSLIVLYTLISLYLARFFIHYFYIKELNEDNCACAEDWREKWVQYGPIINIVIGYILIFIQYKLLFLKGKINNLSYTIPIALSLLYISYIYKLIKIKCECSNNWKRDFILFFTIFIIIFQILGLFLSLN